MLILRHNEKYQVRSLHFDRLGEIVSPCTISYICSGLTFIGSTCGDSQFIEIHSNKNWRKLREAEEAEEDEEDEDDDIAMNNDANRNNNNNNTLDDENDNKMANNEVDDEDDGYIEILEEYTNLGPIVDMVTVDLERQGQCQLVCYLSVDYLCMCLDSDSYSFLIIILAHF